MRRTVLLAGALLCVLFIPAAHAKHHSLQKMQTSVGCTDPVMRPCTGMIPLEVFGKEISRVAAQAFPSRESLEGNHPP